MPSLSMVRRALRISAAKRGLYLKNTVDPNVLRSGLANFWPVQTELLMRRVGGDADGGYLVPNDLDGLKACFSPGVATSAKFEEELASLGIPSYAIDASIDIPPTKCPLITFDRLFLGTETRGNVITLYDWINKYSPEEGDLLLQMDIEGAEWPVLSTCPMEILTRFRIMVIEFHDLDQMLTSFGNKMISATMERIRSAFHVVHIHPNNCYKPFKFDGITIPEHLEVTLIRKDRVQTIGRHARGAHSLDRPCVRDRIDYTLEVPWYE